MQLTLFRMVVSPALRYREDEKALGRQVAANKCFAGVVTGFVGLAYGAGCAPPSYNRALQAASWLLLSPVRLG